MDWKYFLTDKHPREDLFEEFPPEHLDEYEPALLNEPSRLATARVAARVMHIVAQRGGSRMKASRFKKLLDVLDSALPAESRNQCDEEAARVLNWLETPGDFQEQADNHRKLPPELDIMFGSDIESRISVVRFAMQEDYDLEMEYFNERSKTWPRLRCSPVELSDAAPEKAGDTDTGQESDETSDAPESAEDEDQSAPSGATGEFGDPILTVDTRDGRREISVKHIRWLMPVRKKESTTEQKENPPGEDTGRVLEFPGSPDNEASDDE